MSISEKLRQRIRDLEREQERQQEDLNELNQLRDLAAITELEHELAELSKPGQGSNKPAKTSVQNIDLAEEILLAEETKDVKIEPTSKEIHDIDLLDELDVDAKPVSRARQGFVVCLMFNTNSPSEWADDAGGGWRGKGMGTVYANKTQAEKRYNELKNKWPDYPIQIHSVKP